MFRLRSFVLAAFNASFENRAAYRANLSDGCESDDDDDGADGGGEGTDCLRLQHDPTNEVNDLTPVITPSNRRLGACADFLSSRPFDRVSKNCKVPISVAACLSSE